MYLVTWVCTLCCQHDFGAAESVTDLRHPCAEIVADTWQLDRILYSAYGRSHEYL